MKNVSSPAFGHRWQYQRPLKHIMIVFIVSTMLIMLWFFLSAILAVDQGLDITDEGLYLLEADHPNLIASWGFPYGWHTGLLFSFVHFDIAAFRVVGALLIVAASSWLGWVATSLGDYFSCRTQQDETGVSSRNLCVIGAIIGGTGILLYYGGFHRTPSYNWLNLFGILVGAASMITLANAWLRQGALYSAWWKLFLVFIFALGLFLTIPAKPSTPVFLLAVIICFLGVVLGWRKAIAIGAIACISVLVWIGIAIVAGVWPADFYEVFLRLLKRPSLMSTQTPVGAAWNVLESSFIFFKHLKGLSFFQTTAFSCGLAMLGLGALMRKLAPHFFLGRLNILLGFSLFILGALNLVAVPLPWLNPMGVQSRWIYDKLVTASLLIVIAAVIVGLGLRDRKEKCHKNNGCFIRDSYSWLALVLLLTILPFIFGFGSSHEDYRQASLAAGLFSIAAITALSRFADVQLRYGLAAALLLFVSAVTWVTISDSKQLPFRIAPIEFQTSATTINVHGAKLYLDQDLANTISALRHQANDAGWKNGTPLIGVAWRWSSTLPYVLGAQVSNSLMLTIFGYPGSNLRAEYQLAHGFVDFPLQDAWILTTSTNLLDSEKQKKVEQVLKSIEKTGGRPFPQYYECVANAAGFLLWRPSTHMRNDSSSVVEAEAYCPAANPPKSAYNADLGWRKQSLIRKDIKPK